MSNEGVKTPPIWLVRRVEAARAALQNLSQRLAPGNVTLIDLGLGGLDCPAAALSSTIARRLLPVL
jgi:hypothetical protein